MATIKKFFTSKEIEEFDEFLRSHEINLEIRLEWEEMRVYFQFRTNAHRLTEQFRWWNIGTGHNRVPVYEEVQIQCSISFTMSELKDRTNENIINELKEFVTQEFHLNEEHFTIGLDEYIH